MFKINQWKIDTGENTINFYYLCNRYGEFCEKVNFPDNAHLSEHLNDVKFTKLLDIMAAYIGVSYYKLEASNKIEFDLPFSDISKTSIEKIYTEGLGEFYIRNNLNYPPDIKFSYPKQGQEVSNAISEDSLRSIKNKCSTVAFGGGKDSHVSISLLDRLKLKHELVSVVLANSVEKTLQKLSYKKITFIQRRIDPKLISLVKEGKGYNGHIPITAINSIILSVYSYLVGNNWVIFSNERGASVPTMYHGVHAVNHQYSKSIEFEQLFRNTLNDICGNQLQYFSLLRPFSELWIAAYLGREAVASHNIFSSCNKNFVFEGKNKLEDGKRWCGSCSKCIYTAIITASHLSKNEFLNIFGSNILNNDSNIQTAKDLCGIGESKPWECVGDFADTASSLSYLASHHKWEKDIIPQILAKELHNKYGKDYLKNRFLSEIKSRSAHFLPEEIKEITENSYSHEA